LHAAKGCALLARDAIGQDPDAILRVVLALLKVLAVPRTEEALATSSLREAKIECRAGCNACCHQNVEVSIPEAILVALQVADPADPRRASILETTDAVAGLGLAERIRTGRPCPLLVDGRCSVYDNRPLLCRATLSSDAKGCYDALHGRGTAAIYPIAQFVAAADRDALRGICKDIGLQYDNVELVRTVAAILRDPTTVVRWAGREDVFEPAQAVVRNPAKAKRTT